MSNERIKAWSYSRLADFEQCKLRAKLKYIDRIPEPARPLPPGKTEHANDRGTRIHDAGERFSPLKKDCSPASFDVDGETKAAEETVGFSRAARRAIAKHSGR